MQIKICTLLKIACILLIPWLGQVGGFDGFFETDHFPQDVLVGLKKFEHGLGQFTSTIEKNKDNKSFAVAGQIVLEVLIHFRAMALTLLWQAKHSKIKIGDYF